MSDKPTGSDLMMDDDLELLTRFLNKQLDPERVAQVRRRLDDDPAFRDFAAPVLLAWSIPPRWQREPIQAGELERHWDQFTKKAGFLHQRRKTRRRRLWFLAAFLIAVAVPALLYRRELRNAYRDWWDFATVRADTGVHVISEGILLHYRPDTRLRMAKRLDPRSAQRFKLDAGSLRVEITPSGSDPLVPNMRPVLVETRAGIVYSGFGDFTITVHGDTTDVQVAPAGDRPRTGPLPPFALAQSNKDPKPTSLRENQRARLVRGGKVERLP